MLLDHRGLVPTQTELETIQMCMDLDRLERWFHAAFAATSVTDLLELDG